MTWKNTGIKELNILKKMLSRQFVSVKQIKG